MPRRDSSPWRWKESFPAWMWRNADVFDFIGWLRAYNERSLDHTGFYGLDLYSLQASGQIPIAPAGRP